MANRKMSNPALKVSGEALRSSHMALNFLLPSSPKHGPNLNKYRGRKTGSSKIVQWKVNTEQRYRPFLCLLDSVGS